MGKALGLIEFIGYVPAICAADTALKAASVDLIGIEKVTGGIVTVKITGDVDAVQAAVESAENYASRIGSLRSAHVIPRLDDEVEALLMNSKDLEEEIQEVEEEIEEVYEEIKEEMVEAILEETESKEESLQEDVVECIKNVIEEDQEENVSKIEELEVSEISENEETSKEASEEVTEKAELIEIIEGKEEASEDEATEPFNKEANSMDIKEISKMSVKELRKKIKSLNINITSNKLKSLKKKDLVDILLKYNEEGES
ncbi:BMC domain-containing protein [Clostridium perfringens]|nr:BMC domain-containing protein [Clostridium perfringens]